MGKNRCFLGIFASLFIALFTSNLLASGYDCSVYKKYTSCNTGYYLNGTGVGNSCTACTSVAATDLTQTCNRNATSTELSNAHASAGTISGASQRCTGKHTGGAGGTSAATACTGCSAWGTCTGGTFKATSCLASYYLNNGTCTSCTSVAATDLTQTCNRNATSTELSNAHASAGTISGASQRCTGNHTGGAGGTSTSTSCSGCSSWGTCSGGTFKATSCSANYYLSNGTCTSCTTVSATDLTQSCSRSCTTQELNTLHATSGTVSGANQACTGKHTGGAGGTSAATSCTGCSNWGTCTGGTCTATACSSGYYFSNNKCTSCTTVANNTQIGSTSITGGKRIQTCTGYYTGGAGGTNGSSSCTGCSASTYTCSCNAGYHVSGSGASCTCKPDNISVSCSGGKYIAKGATTCSTQCPANSYCAAKSYTIPYTGATANTGITGTCDSGYSSPAGSSAETQCTKSCSVACKRPSCPSNASCSYGSETGRGTMNQVTQTCNATAPSCSMKFTCNSGYTKSGNSCVPATYTITYKNGGGVGADETQSVTYKSTFKTKPSTTFTRPGYNFSSWGGSYPNPNSDYTYNTAGNTTLTAQWSACSRAPTAPGTCNCPSTQFPNGSGCEACSKSCASVSGFTLGTYDVCKSQTNGQCYRNCTTSDVANSSEVSGTVTKSGTKTCKATSCKENYYVSGSGCAACIPNATCPGGDEPPQCNSGYHMSDGVCEPDEYSITLKKNGGTGTINGSTGTTDATQKCKHGELCDLPSSGLTRTGYAFTGWGDSAGCTSGIYQKIFTGTATMYACWSQQTVKCQAGKYYNGSSHVTCPAGKYCPGTGSASVGAAGCGSDCPPSGTSDAGATSKNQCYITCSAKTITGGKLTATSNKSNYNGSAYPACTYTATCNVGYVASGNGTAAATCTKCEDGQNCPGGSSEDEPEDCPVGSYCEDGIKKQCPSGGTSAAGAGSINDCYKVCPPTLSIENGNGISTGNAYYSGSSYPACQYRAECDKGYTAKNSPSAAPSCVWADPDACPVGYYCPDGGNPVKCPDGGTSDGGALSVTQCYKIFDDYEGFQNGVASAKCFYQTSTTKYDACSILEVKSCIAGYWYAQQNAFLCSGTESGYYSPAGQITQTACPVDKSGGKVESSEYASSYINCYKTCALTVANSTSVAAKDNTVYGISATEYAACSFNVTCKTGYTVANNNTENPSCKANEYTITLDKNGGSGSTPASVKCTFNSGSCELPAVTGLSRPGYTVQTKWCTDKNGTGTCYYAGQSTSTNISATGTSITLYAVWSPNIYEVDLDHQSATTAGAPNTVYLKYATGWYSNSGATTSISKLTTIPKRTGYEFAGYYSAKSGGTQVIGATGIFQTSENALTFTTTDSATIYARWSRGTAYCAPGTYYTGTGTQCQTCKANNYCPGGNFDTDSGVEEGLNACPEQGSSTTGADSIEKCYKTKLVYNASHGSGTQTCNYNDTAKSYSADCKDKVINICDAGYYLADSGNANPDCDPVGRGYYSDGKGTSRTQCPNGGDTETDTSTIIQQCFKTGLQYEAVYGSGTQRCFYSSGSGTSAIYQRDCDTKVINSCRGGYWLADSDDIDCVEVQQNYYSVSGDIERHACPANGKTNGTTSDDILLCYKDGLPYTEAQHGTGEYLCYYTSGEGDNAIYASSCDLPTMTSCDAGYYYDHIILATDCMPADIGYYSPAVDTARYKCPLDGTTETKTSASASDCYRDDMACDIVNGSGEQTCNYSEVDSDYTLNCKTCYVTKCDEGFSQVGNTCINCPEGSVCSDGKQETCASLTDGKYPKSDQGTTDVAMCYTDCKIASNAAAMEGRDYYQSPDTCKIKRCLAGYTLENGQCVECPEGSFCDGTTDPDNPGDDVKSCADLGDGDWKYSMPGATDESGCYQTCQAYEVIYGMAIPVADKAFYPEECEYRGESDTGNPCEIIDGVCVETSCNPGYEMKDGICVDCDREYALSYREGGICQVAECVLGYHPNGDKCETNVQSCTAPNAISAERTWDYSKNAFGSCMIKECDYGYHLALNACVSDVQPCNVENGAGFKEWDSAINDWGECVATLCNPGYTNDPSETNEHTKQCGECKNKYSVLGKLAASSYVQGCEIASCMYQGELYNLEYNECVPICPMSEYEDETGTMVWDESRKKCVRTCKEGYTMW